MDGLKRTARGLAKAPGFTVIVVSTLALGIAATTSIFSVAWGVALAPLPYDEPGELVYVSEELEDGTERSVNLSYVNAVDWKEQNSTFQSIALVRGGSLTLAGRDGAELLAVHFVDPDYLGILGARPVRGRLFGPDDNTTPGGHAVVAISEDLWERRFSSNPGVVGSAINLSGAPYTVIGVVSRSHAEPFPSASGAPISLWIPSMMAGQIDPRGDAVVSNRGVRTFAAIGRLQPRTSAAHAEADLDRVAHRLEEAYPGINKGFGARVQGLQETLMGDLRGPVALLLVGAVVLLLIACFNVANLLLVKGAGREREMAVRLALGAGRAQLVWLVGIESGVLAVAGGTLGVLLARAALPLFLGLIPDLLPPTAEVGLNLPVLAAALVTSVLAGTAFGLLPALRVSGIDLQGSLSGLGRAVGDRNGERMRAGLVVFEIATATVLLASSAVLVESFRSLRRMDPGFETERVLAVSVTLGSSRYPDEAALATATDELLRRVREVPGLEWAHPWGPGRPGASGAYQTTIAEGMVVEELSASPLARRHHVDEGTLADMGIELLRGRDFKPEDRLGGQPVAIVSASMAEDRWPGEDPIGKVFLGFVAPGQPRVPEREWTVIGVVADALHGGRVVAPGGIWTPNDVYFPLAQRPERTFLVLTRSRTEADIAPIRAAIVGFDPDIPVFGSFTMQEALAGEEAPTRFAALLMGVFATTALLLAALGVYGVLAFSVSQRTREIGLRSALGATAGDTVRHLVLRGGGLALGGVAVGSVITVGAARALAAVVPLFPPMGPGALALASALLIIVALLACAIPALRATRIAPMVALKG